MHTVVSGSRFDLRLKPIQRAKFEMLVDKRKRGQSGQEVAVTAVSEEAAESQVIRLRTTIEGLERDRTILNESMGEVKLPCHTQCTRIPTIDALEN